MLPKETKKEKKKYKKAYALLSKKHPSFVSMMRTVGKTYGIASDLNGNVAEQTILN